MLNIHENNVHFYIELKKAKYDVQEKLSLYSDINLTCKNFINNFNSKSSDKLNDKEQYLLRNAINIFVETCIKIKQGNKILSDILFYIDLLEKRPFVKKDGLLLHERLLQL